MTLSVFVFLLGKGLVARAKTVVGDIGVNTTVFQIFVVGIVREAGIGSDNNALFIDVIADTYAGIAVLHAGQNGLQSMVLLTFTEGLRFDNDLVLFVHRRHAVVALDGTFAGGHFGRLVVGDVALNFFRPLTLPHPWSCRL